MKKAVLRKIYLENRKQLTSAEIESLSEKMLQQFHGLKLPRCNMLLSYVPMMDHQEFNVGMCEDDLRSRNAGLITAFPRLSKEHYQMEAIEAVRGFESISNQYGIAEPANGRIVPPEEIDLVFVPLIAFDAKGYRVGYGKGYYDRFLKRCRSSCISVGFSFFEAAPSPEDIDQFDVPLNFCISPLRVYEF